MKKIPEGTPKFRTLWGLNVHHETLNLVLINDGKWIKSCFSLMFVIVT